MSELGYIPDAGTVWRRQTPEKVEVNVEEFVNRRGRELVALTRSELIISVCAAVGFVLAFALRFPLVLNRLQLAGYALALIWVATVLYRNRGLLRRSRDRDTGAAMAANCLAYYTTELVKRRDHVRNAWLWQGPLVIACLLALVPLVARVATAQRIYSAVPFVVLLGIWTVFDIRKRRMQAAELQREIDEIDGLQA